jgi:hypothetical protein
MPANTAPIFPVTSVISFGTTPLTTANTAKDGTGTVVTVATGGANGTRIDAIKIRALGTNVATVMRFFINNGGVNTTATNNTLFYEVTCPATTLSEVASLTDLALVFDGVSLPQLVLPANYKINVTIGTTVAAGLQVTAFGGNY